MSTGQPKSPPAARTAWDLSAPIPPAMPPGTPYTSSSSWHRLGQVPGVTQNPSEVAYSVDIPGDPSGNRQTFVYSPVTSTIRLV